MKTHRTALATTSLIFALTLGIAACGKSETEAKAAQNEAGHADEKGGHEEGDKDGHAEESEGDRVAISNAAIAASQIEIAAAGPGAIRETLNLTGRMMLQPAARAEVRAPYPGPVRAVIRNIGDGVKRGDALVRVESAESLQTYSVNAPISGVILERNASVGDVTGDAPLFVVADLSRLQAELNVAMRDMGKITSGQKVIVSSLDGGARVEAQIASVLPTANSQSQALVARAPVAGSADTLLRPGMAVRADVVLTSQDVSIAIPSDAVQTVEGKSAVFVRVAPETFEARPVTLGRSGGGISEVVSGLKAGDMYVGKNAFLVKAELGKGSASHDH